MLTQFQKNSIKSLMEFRTNCSLYSSISEEKIVSMVDDYMTQVVLQNKIHNIVGQSTLGDFFSRHILDSLQLCSYINNLLQLSGLKKPIIVDLGTGAGIPGLLLAFVFNAISFCLVDKSPVKRGFLSKMVTRYSLGNVELIEGISNINCIDEVDIFVSRAFKSLNQTLAIIAEGRKTSFSCIFLKGSSFFKEELESKALFSFDIIIEKSCVHSDGIIAIITNVLPRI